MIGRPTRTSAVSRLGARGSNGPMVIAGPCHTGRLAWPGRPVAGGGKRHEDRITAGRRIIYVDVENTLGNAIALCTLWESGDTERWAEVVRCADPTQTAGQLTRLALAFAHVLVAQDPEMTLEALLQYVATEAERATEDA